MSPVTGAKLYNFQMAKIQASRLRNAGFPVQAKIDLLRKIADGSFTYSPDALPALQKDLKNLISHDNAGISTLANLAYEKLFQPASPPTLLSAPAQPPTPPQIEPAEPSVPEITGSAAITISTASISGGREDKLDGISEGIPSSAGLTGKFGRRSNEDGLLMSQIGDVILLAVADGMGGHEKGEVASMMALRELETDFEIGFDARASLVKADQAIRAIPTENQTVGTTIATVLIEGNELTGLHYGDSRTYVYRPAENKLELLTIDDNGAAYSKFAQAKREGRILEEAEIIELDREIEAAGTAGSRLMAGVGIAIPEEFPPTRTTLKPGDIVLIISDGAKLPVEILKNELSKSQKDSPLEIAESVIKSAYFDMEINGLRRVTENLEEISKLVKPEILTAIEEAIQNTSLAEYFAVLARYAEELSHLPSMSGRKNRSLLDSLEGIVGGDNITVMAHVHGYMPDMDIAAPDRAIDAEEESTTPTATGPRKQTPAPPASTTEPTNVHNVGQAVTAISVALGLEPNKAAELALAADPSSTMPLQQRISILTGISQRLTRELAEQAERVVAELPVPAFEAEVRAFVSQVEQLEAKHQRLRDDIDRFGVQLADGRADIEYAQSRLERIGTEDARRRSRYERMERDAQRHIDESNRSIAAREESLSALEQSNRAVLNTGRELQAKIGDRQTAIREQAEKAQQDLSARAQSLSDQLSRLQLIASSEPLPGEAPPRLPSIPPPPQPTPVAEAPVPKAPPPEPKRSEQAPRAPKAARPPVRPAAPAAQPPADVFAEESTTVAKSPQFSSDTEVEAIMAGPASREEKAGALGELAGKGNREAARVLQGLLEEA